MNQELDRKVAARTKELEIARAKAEEYAKSKSAFLANMSHEVRTPASQIIGAAELLSDTKVNSEQSDYIQIIIKSGKLLLNLLNDILDLSKLDSNKLVLESTEFDLHQTVQVSVEAFTIGKPLQLCYLMDENLPRLVVGDAMRLQQIFTNLLSNSIKFTERGHIVLYTHSEQISTSVDKDVYEVTFSVTDTGSGISPDRLQNIFDRFEQENMSISRLHGGTGLGLSISQDLCGLMGSRLHAESTVGVGSTFYFTIRFDSPKRKIDSDIDKPLSPAKALILSDQTTLEFQNTHKTVLQLQLESFDTSVNTEHLSPDVLLKYSTSAFNCDVIFLDLSTSSSEESIAYVQQLKSQGSSVPVVIIHLQNAFDFNPVQEKSPDQCIRYLCLPYKQSSLIQVVDEILRHPLPNPKSPSRSSDSPTSTATNLSTSSSSSSSSSSPSATPVANLKILLAEDNIVNQKVLQAMFKRIGYKIDIAANGVEAAEMSKKVDYDAIFMDVRMPLKDGLEATTEILARYDAEHRSRKPRIIGLSADALVENQEVGLSAGMSAYLSKPVSKETIINILREIFDSPS
ncbi:histidine kinase-like ATPase [Paraphysoderma sedebokerense]|nr:histidine kinase-like ATPase [Paraphysoderma sedebokerense]